MGRQARKNRRLSPYAVAKSDAVAPDRRARLLLVVGVAVILVVGLAVGVVVVAAGTSQGSGSLPPGTQTFVENDHAHVTTTVTYDRMPPAGGAHNPTPLNCGIYTDPVPNENAVHSLEHGAVWITYRPDLTADQLSTLQQLVTSNYVGTERYLILSPYAGIPSPIVASAWGAQLGVDSASDSRLADFIHHFAGGGQGGEPGGPCSGGVGTPAG